jgi:hypothetical protein
VSWVIATIGIIAWRLTVYEGRRKQLAYVLGFVNQIIWIGYALATTQYGFVLGAVVFGAVCLFNLWQIRKRGNG